MPSTTSAFQTALLNHYFQNAAHTTIGDAGGLLASVGADSFRVSLHETYPGDAGTQTTGEADFGAYARILVARSAGGWATSGDTVDNVAAVTFATCTSHANNPNTIMFWGIGSDTSGAGNLYFKGHFGSAPEPFAADVSADIDTIVMPDHGMVATNRVVFYTLPGDVLPSGLAEGTVYFVVATVTVDTFKVSATEGGGAITLGNGAGYAAKVTPRVVDTNDQFEIAIGDLNLTIA